MIITDILTRNAALYGSEVSLVEVNPALEAHYNHPWQEYELIEGHQTDTFRREITWQEFDDQANRFANLLLERGIKKGDKVAILLMNCLEWLPVYFGILRSGAVAVPLNFRYTAEEIKYCLGLSEAMGLVFGPEFIDRMEAISDEIPAVNLLLYVGENGPAFAEDYIALTAGQSSAAPEVTIAPEDNGAIYFSSGTTGFPKAILHDHRSLLSACYTEQNHHRQTREDNFLCIPPLYHTGAKMHWFGSFLAGSKAVLLSGVKPSWILKAVSEEKITIVWLLVPWASDILNAIESGEVKLEDYQLDQWRLMHIGAQPVPSNLIQEWRRIFPHHQYDTNYGLTEATGPGCVHLGVENLHKIGAIGVPGFDWECKIVNEQGAEVADGAPGELAIKGPGVMKAYYGNPDATAEVLKGGWLHTGDVARRDGEGFIWLVDRKKDVIITGGENIFPFEIEDFLQGHPDIQDVAVIGLPSLRLGEIATAIVQLKPGRELASAEIDSYCQALPRYKRPRRIIFGTVPRNPTGKIEKPKLREKFGGRKESL